jgi:hypothetical protein
MFVEPSSSFSQKLGNAWAAQPERELDQDDLIAKVKAFLRLSSRV